MIAKLFIFLYNKISFTSAIVIFTTTWSWVTSFYGFFFVYGTVNFQKEELSYLLLSLMICTGLAIFLHLAHFGLFHRFGFSGFTSPIRQINKFFNDKHIFKNYNMLEGSIIEEIFQNLTRLPRINVNAAVMYTQVVVIAQVIIFYNYTGELEKTFFILVGGFFAALIIGYCTYSITEYFIGPYKARIEQILMEKNIKIKSKILLSFKFKSVAMLLLILSSMLILTILIRRSEKPIVQITIFILVSLLTVTVLIFLIINTINIDLNNINKATRRLAEGGRGMFFPSFSDKEFIDFADNYNMAAVEINEIRTDLERKIEERTEELSLAYKNLNTVYSQIQADLLLAKRIQKRIMPENLDGIEGLMIFIHYYPMADIGGDIYDAFQLRQGYIRIFLADAIGHGIQAALITMIIKGEYEKVKNIEDVSEVLKKLNNSFIDLYFTLNAFFSCIVIDIDVNSLTIRFASAGHTEQIHIHRENVEFLQHTGRLIGISKDEDYTVVEKNISYKDKLLLYTDGLFEQYDEENDEYSEGVVRSIIEKNRGVSLGELQNNIIQGIRGFMKDDNEISGIDDITLIGIEIIKDTDVNKQ